jgi:hypothetical protein
MLHVLSQAVPPAAASVASQHTRGADRLWNMLVAMQEELTYRPALEQAGP